MNLSSFSSFLASIKPLELRCIGKACRTLSFEKGAPLFKEGEPSSHFYIISKGIVRSQHAGSGSILSLRGNAVGLADALACEPHGLTAICEEATRVYEFRTEALQVLAREVPEFALYLAKIAAAQSQQFLQQAALSAQKTFNGHLARFDLVTIFQTLIQSGVSGTLLLHDQNEECCGKFDLLAGQPVAGSFRSFDGLEAFWQAFLEPADGTFSFMDNPSKPAGGYNGTTIQFSGSADALLLQALQHKDEYEEIKAQLPPSATLLIPTGSCPDQSPYSDVWLACAGGDTNISELPAVARLCSHTAHKAVLDLLGHGSLTLVSDQGDPGFQDRPEEDRLIS